jgi:chemotaxis protein MotA
MATSIAVDSLRRRPAGRVWWAGLDAGILIGIAIASIALIAGIAVTGVSIRYFFQPTGVLIVVGGTLGVMLITTPSGPLLFSLRHTLDLFSRPVSPTREDLIEEIISYSKVAKINGMVGIEPSIDQVSNSFLREALLLAMDTEARTQLESALESKMRLCERQSEAAAKVLELAGGFTPTMGVLGTVVGLIDVLRQFSSLTKIAYGVGAAFTSTIYGLALANLVLLPAAYRIRARATETLELQELMTEGALCLFDGMHPRLVRYRLHSFINAVPNHDRSLQAITPAPETGQI